MKKFSWDAAKVGRNTGYVLAVLGLALLAHELLGQHGVPALRHEQKEIQTLQQQIHQLKQNNEQLSRQVVALETDPRAIEAPARALGLVRPGEIIINRPEKHSNADPLPPTAPQTPAK